MSTHHQDHHQHMPSLELVHGGHQRCSHCSRIIYADPKLAVAAIIPIRQGIVLIKRAIEPKIGMWSFPSGYVNRGEKLERAIEREVSEECGLQVETKRLVGLYSDAADPVVLAVYESIVRGGTLKAGDETSDAAIFPIDQTPQLAFEHDTRIIKDWLETQ